MAGSRSKGRWVARGMEGEFEAAHQPVSLHEHVTDVSLPAGASASCKKLPTERNQGLNDLLVISVALLPQLGSLDAKHVAARLFGQTLGKQGLANTGRPI